MLQQLIWSQGLQVAEFERLKRLLGCRDLEAAAPKLIESLGGRLLVGDHLVDGFDGNDRREAAASELAGVANRHYVVCGVNHCAIEFGFEHVGRRKAETCVEAFDAEEKNVGLEVLERL